MSRLLLIPLFAAGFIILYEARYRRKKQQLYQSDERWKEIELRASKMGYTYFRFVGLVIIGMLLFLIVGPGIIEVTTIPLHRALLFAFLTLIGGRAIELAGLMYFDQRM